MATAASDGTSSRGIFTNNLVTSVETPQDYLQFLIFPKYFEFDA
jgi:hypothetical protein